MFTVYLVARKTNAKPSRESWPTGKEVVFAGTGPPALFLIFAVVGGIRANIFTPTEAGAVAVLIVLAIGFLSIVKCGFLMSSKHWAKRHAQPHR